LWLVLWWTAPEDRITRENFDKIQAGMTLAEVAAVLIKDYRVWNALNLDGGGSTTMAWEDPSTGLVALLNSSSDANPAGRSVASSLAVFARRQGPRVSR
jgi:exopolysaccharide biosynthesis protein